MILKMRVLHKTGPTLMQYGWWMPSGLINAIMVVHRLKWTWINETTMSVIREICCWWRFWSTSPNLCVARHCGIKLTWYAASFPLSEKRHPNADGRPKRRYKAKGISPCHTTKMLTDDYRRVSTGSDTYLVLFNLWDNRRHGHWVERSYSKWVASPADGWWLDSFAVTSYSVEEAVKACLISTTTTILVSSYRHTLDLPPAIHTKKNCFYFTRLNWPWLDHIMKILTKEEEAAHYKWARYHSSFAIGSHWGSKMQILTLNIVPQSKEVSLEVSWVWE